MTGTILIVIAVALVAIVIVVLRKRQANNPTSLLDAEAPIEEGLGEQPTAESETPTEEIHAEPEVHVSRFVRGWGQMELPIIGVVSIIDQGKPGVGLSAMQMDALGVRRGVVLLEFNGHTCEAKVWNAIGPDAMRGSAAAIRITNSVARELGCGIDDEIKFVKVVTANLPVEV